MWASKVLTFQITSISLLLAAMTVTMVVEHPEWSHNALTEWNTAAPFHLDERVKLLASPD